MTLAFTSTSPPAASLAAAAGCVPANLALFPSHAPNAPSSPALPSEAQGLNQSGPGLPNPVQYADQLVAQLGTCVGVPAHPLEPSSCQRFRGLRSISCHALQ